MSEVEREVRDLVERLGATPALDHTRNAIIAGLNSLPVVGGLFGTLTDKYIPERKGRRLLEFIAKLRVDLDRLQARLQTKYIQTDDFAFVFERTLRGVEENHQAEKLDAFRGILLNALISGAKVAAEERELFLRVVDSLTTRHMRILRALANPVAYDVQQGRRVGEGSDQGSTSMDQIVTKLFPEYTLNELDYLFVDLNGLGLIKPRGVGKTMMTDKGIHHLEGQLTPFGQAFVKQIAVP